VLFEGDYISPSEWTLTNNGKQLEWISGASVEEDDVYTISGRFAPRFECVGNESPIVQVGADGVTLPQKWQLRLLQPGEFEL
jgi:hypothetical protein